MPLHAFHLSISWEQETNLLADRTHMLRIDPCFPSWKGCQANSPTLSAILAFSTNPEQKADAWFNQNLEAVLHLVAHGKVCGLRVFKLYDLIVVAVVNF